MHAAAQQQWAKYWSPKSWCDVDPETGLYVEDSLIRFKIPEKRLAGLDIVGGMNDCCGRTISGPCLRSMH
jgi:hypothetical protein